MRYLLLILAVFTVQATAQGYYDSNYTRQYGNVYGNYGAHRTPSLRQQNATIIPRLDGGHTVMEPFGRTVVTPADSMGRVRVYRHGETTW